jgi:hypothetical protein
MRAGGGGSPRASKSERASSAGSAGFAPHAGQPVALAFTLQPHTGHLIAVIAFHPDAANAPRMSRRH